MGRRVTLFLLKSIIIKKDDFSYYAKSREASSWERYKQREKIRSYYKKTE